MKLAARAAWWLAAGMVASSVVPQSGCNGQSVPVVPVAGQVLLNGDPLAGATVTFQPIASENATTPAAMGSVGTTDAEGRFTLRLIAPDRLGAVPGRHAVTITTSTSTNDDRVLPQGERVPKGWRNGSRTFVVPTEGTLEARFEIAAP